MFNLTIDMVIVIIFSLTNLPNKPMWAVFKVKT